MAFLRTFSKRWGAVRAAWLLAASLLWISPAAFSSDNVGDGWRLQRQEPARQIRVYLHDRPSGQYRDVYAVTTIKGSTQRIEAVLSDVVVMPQWASRVSEARLIKRQGNVAWIYIQYKLPYPFKPREVVVKSERQESNGIVTIRSQAVPGYVRETSGKIRMHSVQSSWRLTPQSNGNVKIELWGSAEPGGLIPAVVYNFNLADDALQTLRQLRRMSLREKYQDKAPTLKDIYQM